METRSQRLSPQVMAAFGLRMARQCARTGACHRGKPRPLQGPVIEIEDLPAAVLGIAPTASFYLGRLTRGHGKPTHMDIREGGSPVR